MDINNVKIRLEKREEYGEVENLIRESFWNVYRPGYLDKITGVYQTPSGYYVDDKDVELFDSTFPYREKLKLPGQIF